jgi:L-lactate utilization protein LutC
VDRDAFIARVAARLRASGSADGAAPPTAAEAAAAPAPAPPVLTLPASAPPLSRDELLELFAARLGEAGGTAVRVPGREQALAAIAEMAAAKGWGAVACPPSLKWPAIEPLWTGDPRRAEFGLSVAEWGVAQTGSVFLRHGGEHGRGFSVVPPVAGILVPASRIVPRLGDVLGRLHDAAEALPACVAFVTGPSHSGDIAGVMCYGVHGPAEVHVWVLEDE